MQIAIVGAGLAGLACAHELERLGFAPDIFEKGPAVGARPPSTQALAQFMHLNPGQDIFAYIRDDLMLPLHPAREIRRLAVHGPGRSAEICGRLGYMTIRGNDDRSLERQLLRHVRSPIRFNQAPDVRELQRDYDWVVVATGDQRWAAELSLWHSELSWCVHGARVKGSFRPGELHLFLNTRYAGAGYAVISPLDEQAAITWVGVPDAAPAEAEAFWRVFRAGEGYRWDREESPVQVSRYACGPVTPVVAGNVVLVGAAGGFLETLGMQGQCPSLASGVMAARQIALQDPWLERFARRWRVYSGHADRLRRSVNTWTDEDMDRLAAAVAAGGDLLSHPAWNLQMPGGLMLDLQHRLEELQ